MDEQKIKVHVHDNSQVPSNQKCLGEFELERDKIITLHMHDGECALCPEGHCHYGSIAVCLGLDGSLMISFEAARPPERISFDDFKPLGRFLHQERTANDV